MIQLEAIASLAAQGFIVTVFPDGGFEVRSPEDKRSPAARRQAAYRERGVTKHHEPAIILTSEEPSLSPILPPSLPLSPTTPFPHAPTHLPPHPPASHVREDAPQRVKRTMQPASDETWLKTLENDPTYAGIDIRRELGKMQQWCLLKRKQASRSRFLNWIGRIDKPLIAPSTFNFPLCDEQKQIATWFGREPENWTQIERQIWDGLPMLTKDDFAALKWLYTESGHEHLRQSLQALLDNWQKEIDKAKNFDPAKK